MSVVAQDFQQNADFVELNSIVGSVRSVKDKKTNSDLNKKRDNKSIEEEQKINTNESDIQASPTLPRKNTKSDTIPTRETTRIILSLDTTKSKLEWPSFETAEATKSISKGKIMTPNKRGDLFRNKVAKAIEESKEALESVVVTDAYYDCDNQSVLTSTDFTNSQANSDEVLPKKKKGMRGVFRWKKKGKDKIKQTEEQKETVENAAVVPAPKARNSNTYKLYDELIKSVSGDDSECTDAIDATEVLCEQYKKSIVRFKSSESIIDILPREKEKKEYVQKRTYFCGLFEEYVFTEPSGSGDEVSDDYSSDGTSEKESSKEFGDVMKSLDSVESASKSKSQSIDASINDIFF